jgi:lipopolysaccharide export LptBFGC system permease protein LptF
MAVASEDAPQIGGPAPVTGLQDMLKSFVLGDYARGFLRSVAGQALAVIILIEAIFLAEHFTWVFKDAVRHEADLFGISLILLFTSTEIFDLALAIAILMAAYATLLKMRENREMLVLFASGLGPYQLSALILIVALAGQGVSMLGSGVADPLSRYTQRSILFSSELRSLKKGVATGEFYFFPSYVAYAMDHVTDGAPPPLAPGEVPVIDASKPPAPRRDRTLFVYQQIAPQASRVVTAAQARLDGPDRSGRIVLNLNDFTSHTFADPNPMATADGKPLTGKIPCPTCLDELKGIPRVNMKVRDMSQLMMVDQLLPFNSRGTDTAEQLVFEQLFVPAETPEARGAQMRLLAERFSRSLLAFLAPLFALVAVAFTSRLTSWLALPLGCLALMSVNMVAQWVINSIGPLSVAGALLPVFLLYAAVGWILFTLSIWRHNDFVRPRLGRS